MNKAKLLSLLGFCRKSGNLKSGSESVVKTIVTGKSKLVILAVDASDNSIKKISDKAKYYDVPLFNVLTVDEISKAIGQNNRVAVSITDSGFASSMLKIITK